jgi:hypothetical protein
LGLDEFWDAPQGMISLYLRKSLGSVILISAQKTRPKRLALAFWEFWDALLFIVAPRPLGEQL